MVLVQKWPFFQLFFLGNIGQENVFYDILERKNAFLGYKNKKFEKSNNWHFSKRVNPWFLSKNGHFSNFFFFRQYRTGKCLLWYSRTKKRLSKNFIIIILFIIFYYDIVKRENAFLGYKNKKSKKSKNWHFFKRVNPWFCSKLAIFLLFFQAI